MIIEVKRDISPVSGRGWQAACAGEAAFAKTAQDAVRFLLERMPAGGYIVHCDALARMDGARWTVIEQEEQNETRLHGQRHGG